MKKAIKAMKFMDKTFDILKIEQKWYSQIQINKMFREA
jgi:hypothetical protein